ncbi:MAG: polysaccharide deacetylase [Candidatus Margulisbacteria bacterium]|nr:polysaccharide deacetylase [Candidatus Margulisiibacteriota bacterium]
MGDLYIKQMLIRFFCILFFSSVAVASQITHYKSIFMAFNDGQGQLHIALRSFEKDGHAEYLIVSADTLETDVKLAADIDPFFPKKLPADCVAQSRFMRLISSGELRHSVSNKGLFLTVDLCPSQKPFVREVITQLPRSKEPIPIAIAVTGTWLSQHAEDLEWLKRQVSEGRVLVTWVNHSLTHPVKPDFMRSPGIVLEDEVLKNEQKMLEVGVVPSVFFRFPGLISSDTLMNKLRDLHLIALGSDAWLAKGEIPKKGSIVLVHGNGNEPKGILFLMTRYMRQADHWRALNEI